MKLTDIQLWAIEFFIHPHKVFMQGLDHDDRGWAVCNRPYGMLNDTGETHRNRLSGFLAYDCSDRLGITDRRNFDRRYLLEKLKSVINPEISDRADFWLALITDCAAVMRFAAHTCQEIALGNKTPIEVLNHPKVHEVFFDDPVLTFYPGYPSPLVNEGNLPVYKAIYEKASEEGATVKAEGAQAAAIKFLCNFRNLASFQRLMEDPEITEDSIGCVLKNKQVMRELASGLFEGITAIATERNNFGPLAESRVQSWAQWINDQSGALEQLAKFIKQKHFTEHFTEQDKSGIVATLDELQQGLLKELAGKSTGK